MDQTERELREMLADNRLVRWPTEPQWNAIWLAANAKGYQGTLSAAVYSIAPDLLNADWVEMMDVDPAEAKMMWAEICVRSSVSPFVEQPAPFTASQKADAAFEAEFKARTAKGWKVVSNGPDGMELQGPKKMKLIDQAFLALGILTLVLYGLGVVFIAFALLDYYVYTPPETMTLRRPKP